MLNKIRRQLARLGDNFKTSVFHHNNIYHNGVVSTDKINNTSKHQNMGGRKKMFSQVKSMVKIDKAAKLALDQPCQTMHQTSEARKN